jgi:hypothetical protein
VALLAHRPQDCPCMGSPLSVSRRRRRLCAPLPQKKTATSHLFLSQHPRSPPTCTSPTTPPTSATGHRIRGMPWSSCLCADLVWIPWRCLFFYHLLRALVTDDCCYVDLRSNLLVAATLGRPLPAAQLLKIAGERNVGRYLLPPHHTACVFVSVYCFVCGVEGVGVESVRDTPHNLLRTNSSAA